MNPLGLPASVSFADSDLPVGAFAVSLVVAAFSLAFYILGGIGGNAESEEERRHWQEERGRKRILVEESLRGLQEGKANPVRIWEAIYDEAEGSFVTSPPFGLCTDVLGLPKGWFGHLTEAFGQHCAIGLKMAGSALEEAEAEVQRCLRSDASARNQKALDARKEERAMRLEQLADLVRKCERVAKAFKVDRPPSKLPSTFGIELEVARRLLKRQDQIKRGLTWDIGKQIVDPQISGWLAIGVCFKVLMGAPAPLQVLALSDAARGMARGGDEGYEEFVTAIGNCFLFFCIEKLLQFLARITMIRGEYLFTQTLQRKVYSKMLQQDYEFFDGKPTAVLQNLVHDSTEKVCSSLIFMRVRIIQVLATVFFQVVLIAWRFPQLALIVNMSLPIAGILRYYAKGYIERAGARLKARSNIVGQRTWDVLSNLPTVRAHCGERSAVEDYSRCMAYQARVNTKLHMFNGISQPFLHFCDMICVYVGYYYGGQLIRMGALTTAELMTVIRQFQTVSGELSVMLETIGTSMVSTEHGRDVLELLVSRPKIEPELFPEPACNGRANGKVLPRRLEHTQIEFREVMFAYPGAAMRATNEDVRVLKGLSFVAREEEFTALVGKTGCGKSTITLLLQRLYDVAGGAVLVGGVDVRDQDVRRLRRSIAVVSQEPVLFSTSIHDNLLYALQDEDAATSLEPVEKERLMAEACKRADAWEFVGKLSDGLRTNIGPRGSQLSGGQRQRLTIARAILKDAPMLILDEATSSLDVEAEQAVQQALDHLLCAAEEANGNRRATRLVIAHRLSTVRRADKIIAIAGGVVHEQGTHEELFAKEGGLYARWLRLSMGEDADASPREAPSPDSPGRLCNGRAAQPPHVCAAPAVTAPATASSSDEQVAASLPAPVQRALGELRGRLTALRAELQGGVVGEGGGGNNGSTAVALAEEVERCQRCLGDLIDGRLVNPDG